MEKVKEKNNFNIKDNQTYLKVLGTQSPFADENGACPSFLIASGEDKLLLDCGSGSHRFYNMNELDNLHIAISHLHRDHYNDIFNYMYSSFVLKLKNKMTLPICIFLPSTPTNIVADLKQEDTTFSSIQEIEEGKIYSVGKINFEFKKVIHSNSLDSYAIKVRVDNKVIVYTGDISFASKEIIASFASNADLLICESSLLIEYNNPDICNHLTAHQAGQIAKEANVKTLMLTHFWGFEEKRKYFAEAKEVFDSVIIANETDTYLL